MCGAQVTAAVAKQMAILNTNARYLHGNLVSHAEALTASMPDPLEVRPDFACPACQHRKPFFELPHGAAGAGDVRRVLRLGGERPGLPHRARGAGWMCRAPCPCVLAMVLHNTHLVVPSHACVPACEHHTLCRPMT